MELFLILLAFAVLTALILGPAAFLRASALARSVSVDLDRLNSRLEQLATQLTQVQLRVGTLEANLKAAASPSTPAVEVEPGTATQVPTPTQHQTDIEAQPEAHLIQTQPINESSELQTPALSSLEAWRAVRQREQAQSEQPAGHEPSAASNDEAAQSILHSHGNETEHIASENDRRHTPAPGLSLEEMLAGKVFVWIGAVAMVLTAAFLLKLGFDENIITKPVRVIGAAVFGVLLWCVGEWMRSRTVLIAQALCGAAVAVLYASVLAGHDLYELFGASWAFGMMATITAAAVVLSLRHGPAVALLGMVGGFMLPPVLGETFGGATAGMVLYLLALEIGILAVTGRRGWFGLSALTLLFTVIWSLSYVFFGDSAGERTLTALLIVGTAAAYLVQTARVHRDPNADQRSKRWTLGLSISAVCSAATVVALLVPRGAFSLNELSMLGLISAGTIVLARLDRHYLAMPFATMGLSLLVLVSGAMTHHLDVVINADGPSLSTLFTWSIVYGLIYFIGGYVCLWLGDNKRLFTLLSAIAGPAFYAVILLAGEPTHGLREYWWLYTLLLAGVYALAVVPLMRRRVAEHDWPTAVFTVVSFALLCASIVQGVDHPRIAVCLALVAAVAALIDRRLFIRPLLLAGVAVAALAALMLVVPGPFNVEIKGIVIFNTLLPMYALPALGFGLIAWCARQSGEQRIADAMAWLTVGTLGVMLAVLTRQGFQPDAFTAETFALFEWSACGCILMLGAFVGLWIGAHYKLDTVRRACVSVACIGGVIGFIGALVPGNPLLRNDVVGGWMLALNLVGLYLLPAWLLWLWSRRQAIDPIPHLRDALRVMAIVLIALFTFMQVRNAFHTHDLRELSIGMFESATVALAWMLLGLLIQRAAMLNPQWPVTRTAGRCVFTTGLLTAIIGNVLLLNPLWNAGSVGSLPILNGLWYLLGPAILSLAVIARRCRAADRHDFARLAGFSAIAIVFLLVSLLVRQGFSADGVLLFDARPTSGERYAYSLAWVLLGAGLLVAGIVTRLDTLRYGSLAVLLVAVGKVFLIDTASLDNLYRVLSFFGLGVTLIALGYLYQRLVFRRSSPFKLHTKSL